MHGGLAFGADIVEHAFGFPSGENNHCCHDRGADEK
jgi:hypothetical protein